MTRCDKHDYDITIIGAGPAGCAAGMFCARADLDTIVLTNGRSTLQKCVYVENYLGFPAGITPHDLLELSREHAREAGCTFREGTVETAQKTNKMFEIIVDDESVTTDYIIAASWATSDYLDQLGVETQPEEPGPVDVIPTDDNGETNVNRVYAAGRITSAHHQALVSAGDGARVALHLINEIIPEFYNDWIVPEGYYAQYDRELPIGVEEIDHQERQHRAEAGRQRMRTCFEQDR